MISDTLLRKYLDRNRLVISDDNLNSTLDTLVNFISNNLSPALSGLEKYQMHAMLVNRLIFLDPGESTYVYGSADPESQSGSLKRLLDNFKDHKVVDPGFNYILIKSTDKQYDLLINVTNSDFIEHLNGSK